jgi:hypothetical protein
MAYRLTSLLDIMRKFDAGIFSAAAYMIASFDQGIPRGQWVEIPESHHHDLMKAVEDIHSALIGMDLSVSAASAERVGKALQCFTQMPDGVIHYPAQEALRLKTHMGQLLSRLFDELQTRTVLAIPASKTPYYGKSELFGPKVALEFPNAIEDIAEAGSCLALDRNTACVFHLMRAVEIGLWRLAGALCVDINPKAGWLSILNEKLEPAINGLPESKDTERQRKKHMQQARAHLHSVRLSWRNDTMHPKSTYTAEEAEEVFFHVRTFMRHLADHL